MHANAGGTCEFRPATAVSKTIGKKNGASASGCQKAKKNGAAASGCAVN
jgi:hypothetical protein